MIYKITASSKKIKSSITLPASKSESNRVLIIRALCCSNFEIINLSKSDDTRVLQKILISKKKILDVGAAGTTMRFLTAYLSIQQGKRILTGSERMLQRPVKILVDSLRKLGAKIKYLGKEGFPPLEIEGSKLIVNKIEVEGNISSQFISALLMIGPVLKKDFIIYLKGKILSKPYIHLTLKVMNQFGVNYKWKNNKIIVPFQNYTPKNFCVESDWSAASYWYEIACFADKAEIFLKGLRLKSFQGDSILPDLMKDFGIKTIFTKNGITIKKQSKPIFSDKKPFIFDFKNNPDLAQTILVICAGLKITCKITGLDNLSVKETDRIKAIQAEFQKINTVLVKDGDWFYLKFINNPIRNKKIVFKTYEDHRMAMCLAPLGLIYNTVFIENPSVVKKSYPDYWSDLKSAGIIYTRY